MEKGFKEVIGFDGKYIINEQGIIKNLRDGKYKIVNPWLRGAYLQAKLYLKSKPFDYSVHRLVALNYIPNPDNLEQVNHKDGNKLNNDYLNLEWCTRSENMLHAIDTGLFVPKFCKTGSSNYPGTRASQYSLQGEFIRECRAIKDFKEFGFSPVMVMRVCQGKFKSHKGFAFKYDSKPRVRKSLVNQRAQIGL